MSPLLRILENSAQVLADHDERTERLYSVNAGRPRGGIRFGVADAKTEPGLKISLASLHAERGLLMDFAAATESKRKIIAERESVRLFSIVFANYRPGPAFGVGHKLDNDALKARIEPGGQSWAAKLAALQTNVANI